MADEKYVSHLRTLTESILDEERLVTYVSISKEFCIHVNESKSLMMKAVEEIRQKHGDVVLNVSYVVSGITGDNKARTFVCSEKDMSHYLKDLKLAFFAHIYSINKGKSTEVDKVAFMAVTSFDDYQLCSGSLKNNSCNKRTLDEIIKLKSSSQMLVVDQKVKMPPVKKVIKEDLEDNNTNGFGDKKTINNKPETLIKQETVSPQKNTANINKQKPEVKNLNKPQKGIAGFFSRSDSATSKKITKNKELKINEPESAMKLETDTIQKNGEQMDVDDVVVQEPLNKKSKKHETSASKNEPNKKDNTALNNKSKSNNKSLTQIKNNAKVDKKRKRVLHISDSESDEDKADPFADDEDVLNKQINVDSEDEIPPTPAANMIKVSSNMLNPRKRRKFVNKTYTDEEGYILTRKEEVYESMSENEDPTDMKENIEKVKKVDDEVTNDKPVKIDISPSKNKKTAQKNSKKKISPPQKGKQATLMSFFKKA